MSGTLLKRQVVRQTDIVDWLRRSLVDVKAMRKRRWATEKGFVAYGKDALDFFKEMRSARSDRKKPLSEEERKQKAEEGLNSPYGQHERSQELLRKLKWKRITWDKDASYDEFAQRLVDEDSAFSKFPAFSFFSAHLVRDPAKSADSPGGSRSKPTNIMDITPGSLTSWFSQSNRSAVPSLEKYTKPAASRPPPVQVLWESGEVKILDTASPREVATFLATSAVRVQAVQTRIDQEQTTMVEDLDKARLRLGVLGIKFNKRDTSFWDDRDRHQDPANYVTPAHVRQFLDGALSRAFLLRYYLKGQHIRLVVPGKPYALDLAANEIQIPTNFAEYSFLSVHDRAVTFEAIVNGLFRRLAMVWFIVVGMLIGDLEII